MQKPAVEQICYRCHQELERVPSRGHPRHLGVALRLHETMARTHGAETQEQGTLKLCVACAKEFFEFLKRDGK